MPPEHLELRITSSARGTCVGDDKLILAQSRGYGSGRGARRRAAQAEDAAGSPQDERRGNAEHMYGI